MLAPGNYVQWKSRIKRYIDTKQNHELIHYCLQNPPYKYKWADKDVPVTEGSSETTTGRYMENYKNVSQDMRDQLNAEAIERLKQGESIHVQDLKTNLSWEFGKFTSRDGESFESYYSRFYKMMNELSQELKTVSYHKLYDILKQQQNEVNEIRTKRLARTANPLALVAQQQLVYHPQNHPTHYTQNSSTKSQQAATRNKGKVIVNSPPPIYDQEPYMVAEDDEIIKRYIDTKPNHELIYYCLQNPPYEYKWTDKAVLVVEGSFETTTERYMENYKNVLQDIHDQLNAEAEAVQIILIGIDNDIYSTVDAYPN
nr:hypothetical protein [Tanacetum cinerariifolium]